MQAHTGGRDPAETVNLLLDQGINSAELERG